MAPASAARRAATRGERAIGHHWEAPPAFGTADVQDAEVFTAPQVNIYSADVTRGVAFYRSLGFEETFRVPREGPPIHVELRLDGFTVGIADARSAVADHGLDVDPGRPGRGMEIVLWTDDTDAAFDRLVGAGARPLSAPHDWLGGILRVAWIADPDDNPIELVQRRS